MAETFERLVAAAHNPEAEKRLRAAFSDFGTITLDNKDAFYEKASGDSRGLLSKLKSACGC